MRRTKVVVTLGPSTDSPEVLSALIGSGVDVVRLNAAHGSVSQLESRLAAVRAASEGLGRDVAVLVDLAGPKLRIGEMAPGSVLERGGSFSLSVEPCVGDYRHACVTYSGLPRDVSAGDRLLLDDGRIELCVEATGSSEVRTSVVTGGVLTSNKGLNVPGVTLALDPITAQDREVLAWATDHDVDWIGQSFVRSAADVAALRALMTTRALPVLAKIEKHEAIAEIDAIIETADAVMVARGDLAVETAPERVPVLQRQIVGIARGAGRPVVIATEMLDSMRTRTSPTRAEASDVANAIFTRADAVMLSGETAIGEYPGQAVATMMRIIDAAEAVTNPAPRAQAHGAIDDVQDALSLAVCELASDLGAAAILPLTQSGATALAVARHRPGSPIIAATPFVHTARRLALAWGVRSVVMPLSGDLAQMIDAAVDQVRRAGHIKPGQRVAITAGMFADTPGGTDLIHVRTA